MNKVFFLFIVTTVLGFSSLNAAIYKGQKEFVRKCVKCHTSGQSFIASKTIYEWEIYMEEKGKKLVQVHLDDETAKKSWKYFESKRFSKKLKHLSQFLLEYAKDSGNVPACN